MKTKKTTPKPNSNSITVVVEIPKGCRNKYEFDKKNNRIVFDRMLFSSVHYPSDYGYIPETLALDGDPLDAIVLVWEATFPGCVIESKPIGLFKMWDEKGEDDKILCVPVRDPLWNHINDLSEVPPHLLKEIDHFFSIYKDLEMKKVRVEGWRSLKEAREVIVESRLRYQKASRRK